MKKELKEILQLLKTGNTKKEQFTSAKRIKFLLKLCGIIAISYIFIIGIRELCIYFGLDLPRPDKFDKIKDLSAL